MEKTRYEPSVERVRESARKKDLKLTRPGDQPTVSRAEFPRSVPQGVQRSQQVQSPPSQSQHSILSLPTLRPARSSGSLSLPLSRSIPAVPPLPTAERRIPQEGQRLEIHSSRPKHPSSQVEVPGSPPQHASLWLTAPSSRPHTAPDSLHLPFSRSAPESAPLSLPYGPSLPQERSPLTYDEHGSHFQWRSPDLQSVESRPWLDQFPAHAPLHYYGDR